MGNVDDTGYVFQNQFGSRLYLELQHLFECRTYHCLLFEAQSCHLFFDDPVFPVALPLSLFFSILFSLAAAAA